MRVEDALYFGFFTCFWLDPLTNYWELGYVVNRYALNVTTWGPYFPGWNSPDSSSQAVTIFAAGGLAWGLGPVWILIPWAIVRRLTENRPHWGMYRVLVVALLGSALAELILEAPWALTGTYRWRVGGSWDLFAGHWYHVPLFEIALASIVFSVPVVMLLYRAQRKETEVWPLRGSSSTGLRLLAASGFTQALTVVYLFSLSVAVAFSPVHVPADTPPYLLP
ncbi:MULTISPECIES: spirocyclase AveC family protein [Streptomyces]|uniref:spirocyclase AveC family protein n=1 Tax=Streptomyces TaxID=1883 RepID=UPI00163C91D2|nr:MULTISPECIES: spirocyclase AveC family protein [Streptomyces]MBC2878043.1 spirocyclase AveC family protein [Streptomyces sp. TYQ1024]UBI39997.1 spirocyclase AveC family protein [Streptomyces mobaraensis]UKW32578.1 spirocyclase AveC family protein [Streptomyces sp. TYQ1024]